MFLSPFYFMLGISSLALFHRPQLTVWHLLQLPQTFTHPSISISTIRGIKFWQGRVWQKVVGIITGGRAEGKDVELERQIQRGCQIYVRAGKQAQLQPEQYFRWKVNNFSLDRKTQMVILENSGKSSSFKIPRCPKESNVFSFRRWDPTGTSVSPVK